MWSWLAKLDPNAVIGALVFVGGYIYHQLSPGKQATIAAALSTAQKNALQVADQVMAGLAIAAAVEGKTPDQLRSQLWAEARIQLGHIGVNTDDLPPAISSAIGALVEKYIAGYKSPTVNVVGK